MNSTGYHTLKWRYVKDSSDKDGDDEAWVDFVQWTGLSPVPDSNNWQQIDYKYDVYGRRSEKIIDGYPTRYLYDGDHVIAEYDGNNNLLRKYIGPGIDQPVSMIEVADSNATYYYHYDALGSVIALSDSSGDTVQTYEYSVFGEVAVEDANHTNPYMFAGRRYDIEIGLYYNRARYYNPYIGRFMQTDPVGYGDGMNMYAYGANNSLNFVDASGTERTPADLSYMNPDDPWNYSFLLASFCPQPSKWGIAQYFMWYYWANGKKVDMENTGMLTLFQNDSRVQEGIEEFKESFMRKAEAAWINYTEEQADANDGNEPPEFTFEWGRSVGYNFDGMWGLRIPGRTLRGDPLIILGDGKFKASGSLKADAEGNWEVTFTYYVADAFRDPNPLRKFNPFARSTEFKNATPYLMFGEWKTFDSGFFSL